KERSLVTLAAEAKSDYNFGVGIVVSIVSGVLSVCFIFGIDAGKPMEDVANQIWKAANPNQGDFLYQNNVSYIVILWGGFTTNVIWCLYLLTKNKTFSDYTKKTAP